MLHLVILEPLDSLPPTSVAGRTLLRRLQLELDRLRLRGGGSWQHCCGRRGADSSVAGPRGVFLPEPLYPKVLGQALP